MQTKNLGKRIWSCLDILPAADRKKYYLAVSLQSAMALFDLVGVALLGLVGSLAVRGAKSQAIGTRVEEVLKFLHLSNLTLSHQVIVLSISAVVLLTFKSIFAIYFSGKVLFFLGYKSSQISSRLLNKTLAQGYLGVQENTQSEIQYATGDGVVSIALGVLGLTANFVADCTLLVIVGFGVFIIDPFSAITSVGLFGAIGIILYFSMSKRAKKIGSKMARLSLRSNSSLYEVLGAYREIYSRDKLGYYVEKISELKREFAAESAKQTLLPNISKYVIELTVTISALLVAGLEFGTRDAAHATASLALFMAAGSRIAPALLRMQQGLVQIQGNLGLAEPTLKLMRHVESVELIPFEEKPPSFNHAGFKSSVKVSDLSFSYEKSGPLTVDHIDIDIHPGEMVAIVGPSGSGKSTLVDLLLGIISPDSGSVQVSGIAPRDAVKKWPGAIGYVPQGVNLLNASIYDNLEIGYEKASIPHSVLDRALEKAHLNSIGLSKDEPIGENGSKLSGGQRQRLGIARALVLDPKILILDEATSALDSITENEISITLQGLKGEVSLVVIAHRLSTVKTADKIIYLNRGRVIAQGKFEEVRQQVPDFNTQAELMGL